jgi:hypothetical protein
MTITEAETAVLEAPDPAEEFQRLGAQLRRTAETPRDKAAVQALVEERTILELPAVRRDPAAGRERDDRRRHPPIARAP